MRNAVFVFTKFTATTKTPSSLIANTVASVIPQTTLIDDARIADETWDTLFIANGMSAFCAHLEPLACAVRTARRVVWIENDYAVAIPSHTSKGLSPFRAAFRHRERRGLPRMDVWTTIRDNAARTPHSSYINWNALFFDPSARPMRYDHRDLRNSICYYGYFRQARVAYFERYFRSPRVLTYVYSASRKKFTSLFHTVSPLLTLEDPLTLKGEDATLRTMHGAGLYLEDPRSHRQFHSPGTRFYEMLNAGLPMAFQPEAATQLAAAGFDVTPYTVGDARAVKQFLKHGNQHAIDQRDQWASQDHRDDVLTTLLSRWRSYKKLLKK